MNKRDVGGEGLYLRKRGEEQQTRVVAYISSKREVSGLRRPPTISRRVPLSPSRFSHIKAVRLCFRHSPPPSTITKRAINDCPRSRICSRLSHPPIPTHVQYKQTLTKEALDNAWKDPEKHLSE